MKSLGRSRSFFGGRSVAHLGDRVAALPFDCTYPIGTSSMVLITILFEAHLQCRVPDRTVIERYQVHFAY